MKTHLQRLVEQTSDCERCREPIDRENEPDDRQLCRDCVEEICVGELTEVMLRNYFESVELTEINDREFPLRNKKQ